MDNYVPIYSEEVERALKEEFKDILKDKIYLDHAGATLYSQKQIADVHAELSKNLFGNPHSKSVVSKTTEDAIDAVRYQILDFFGTSPEDYTVIFTSGATAALKLVAETFNYQNGRLVYLGENHTSVLGMREYAPTHSSISHQEASDIFSSNATNNAKLNLQTLKNGFDNDITSKNCANNLFVYPAQCNFSGCKYPLSWIRKTHEGYLNNYATELKSKAQKSENWFCLLDAASFVATNPLNLAECQPDFVCVSFYKIFGYPTGLGALLVRNSSSHILQKKYFGGGTVFMALASRNVVVHRGNLQEKFEDGTISFLSIAALKHGFATVKRHNLKMATIQAHVFSLACYVYNALKRYRHYNNTPVCVLYHDGDFATLETQGGIVNFNVLRPDGAFIGFAEVMHIANLFNISLRTGCFCNPGACQRHLGITSDEVQYYFEMGHVCGDQRDLIDGKPTGSVRISFGYMSTKAEADAILNMVTSCFVQVAPPKLNNLDTILSNRNWINNVNGGEGQENFGVLEKIYIYPIKSCAALELTHAWRLIATGLQFDREWMIVNQDGVCLTQKHETRLCLVQPTINLQTQQLVISFDGDTDNAISIDLNGTLQSYRCQSKVCGDKIQGYDCGDDVATWLDAMLGRDGLRLIKQYDRTVRAPSRDGEMKLSLVNKAQFLLINKASVEWLYDRVPDASEDGNERKESLAHSIARFRPNLLMDFGQAFIENDFGEIYIGGLKFLVQGKCTRCQMICIDQTTGEKTVEPLRTLSRALQGRITFGIYLQMDATIANGDCAIAPAMTTTGITASDVSDDIGNVRVVG